MMEKIIGKKKIWKKRMEKRKTKPLGIFRRVSSMLLCLLLFPAFLTGFTYQKDKLRIYDDAGLLSEEEKEDLEQLYQEYSLEDKMDYILLTANDTEGMETREYAEKFYLEKGFGYDQEEGDGNLLCIDMGSRHVEMIDRGICASFVRDEEVEEILDEVTPRLGEGEYAEAAKVYARAVHDAFVTDTAADAGGESPVRYAIYGAFALILAGIVTGLLIKGNKSSMTADFCTYGKKVQVNPRTKQDRYLRTVTIPTPKAKHGSDGGGGNVDSKGFGGGGRDF